MLPVTIKFGRSGSAEYKKKAFLYISEYAKKKIGK